MNPSLGNLRCTWPQLFSQSWGLFLLAPLRAMSGIFGACRFQGVLVRWPSKHWVNFGERPGNIGKDVRVSPSEGKEEASRAKRSMSPRAAGDLQLA
jgi:hypothetical protein